MMKISTLPLMALMLISLLPMSSAADLVIRIPGDLSQQDGFYRLYYKPEVGSPQVCTRNVARLMLVTLTFASDQTSLSK